jgi:hypothetical protein
MSGYGFAFGHGRQGTVPDPAPAGGAGIIGTEPAPDPGAQSSRSVTLDDPSIQPPAGSRGARRPARGLRAQLLASRDAAIELARAHVDLAKAEVGAIAGEVGRLLGLVAAAIAVLLLAGLLVVIGTSLFLGEWLLGSIGWGVLEGFLLLVAIAVSALLAAVGVEGRRLAGSFVGGLVVAVVAGIALGLEWPNQAYAAAGEAARLNVAEGDRPLVVGLLVGALVGVLIGFVAALRIGSGGGRVGAIVGLAILGALGGAFSAITFGPQVGAGVGITVGYLTWIALMVADVARQGVDFESMKDRFYPTTSIDTGKETLEWLQKRMPPGIGS